ncbi:hypothetical protein [Paenibacillus sp. Marseille-Q4541]|uniref:hypothetical protein n=1 Tax=Paenibacillus sp. Marseille-Q4541 TaxID=2831522 RepID=UPI001BAD9D87|nr:hypothetical protein [Paenibacillus sp. Marseille-Q4541]
MLEKDSILLYKKTWVIAGILLIILWRSEHEALESVSSHLKPENIKNFEMTKVMYTRGDGGVKVYFTDVNLQQDEVRNITDWLNAASDLEKVPISSIPGSISSGIRLYLKPAGEVLIQYNRENIYITRTGVFNKEVRYIDNNVEFKQFFDKHLEGSFLGQKGTDESA